ncbi:MAG: glycosyltransferase [Actinobacteria bacterium]|nr:glycosyltransferase [Actinomycetota bacterium]
MTLAIVAAGWLAGWVLLWRLPRLPAAAGAPDPGRLAVVIPARDEAATLPILLESLRHQSAPPAEVVVVDDSSSDGTAGVAVALGARVVEAGALPPGWAGKAWACHVGTAATAADRLVFLDADVRLAPDALARLAATDAGGLVSVQPFHAVERIAEHASAIPNVVALMASGIGAIRPARRPRLAFGPCLSTSRRDLAAAGGFGAVRDEVLEDAALARRYDAAGLPVRCFAGGATIRFRMFPSGGRAIVQGWSRTLAGGVHLARPLPSAGTALWITALLAVTVDAVRSPGPVVALAWAACAVQLWWLQRQAGSFRWWSAVAFPVLVTVFVALFAWSAFAWWVLRRVTWRRRTLAVRPRA